MGAPAAAAQLAVLLTQSEGNLAGATVERAMLDSLPTALRPEGDAWDWWSTARIPRRLDGERAVSITANLDAATAGEIQDLLNVASPGHWAPPGHPTALEWAWVRHPVAGNIVACASHTRQSQDVPHLASVATHPQHRGQGWARVVVAALTRYLLETGSPAVTLGMHADNAAARRVYTDLGFTVKHSWMSGRFPH